MVHGISVFLKGTCTLLQVMIMLIPVFALQSCEKILFSGEGQEVVKTESYEYFSKLTFYDIFDVELKTDSVYSVKLFTYEKYLHNISIQLDSAELVFSDFNFNRWLPDYPRPKVIIGFPQLDDQILTRSPIDLTSYDTLKLEKLDLIILGKTGNFDLTINIKRFKFVTGSDNFDFFHFRGRAGYAFIWPRGSTQVDASQLACDDCHVYNNSVGDCYVNVNHKIEARLNTAGNVIYSGNPEEIVIIEESGSGRLRPSGNK